jgi:hypothetical protein
MRRLELIQHVRRICTPAGTDRDRLSGIPQLAGYSTPALAGALLWMIADLEYPDYDGFTVHVPPSQVTSPPLSAASNLVDERWSSMVSRSDNSWSALCHWALSSYFAGGLTTHSSRPT